MAEDVWWAFGKLEWEMQGGVGFDWVGLGWVVYFYIVVEFVRMVHYRFGVCSVVLPL